jgi:hypothetical protein
MGSLWQRSNRAPLLVVWATAGGAPRGFGRGGLRARSNPPARRGGARFCCRAAARRDPHPTPSPTQRHGWALHGHSKG